MCYAAQIEAEYRKFLLLTGADIRREDFVALYWKQSPGKMRTPRALDHWFIDGPARDGEIAGRIAARDAQETIQLEQEIFRQRKRQVEAERSLQRRVTKSAQENLRIAGNRIARCRTRLSAMKGQGAELDSRFYPGWHAPLLVSEGGRRVVRPMRYRCRMPGWNEDTERRFPGTYCARRDRLEQSWSRLFGVRHGVLLASGFLENVEQIGDDGVARNQRLEFRPSQGEPMLLACVWSQVPTEEGELLSFAVITDDPPPEIAATGHDRCPIPLRREYLDAWLNPDRRDLAACQAILDDRERPYFEHREAIAA